VTVAPETRIEDAIKIMGAKRIRRLPVVKDGKLIGMVTERDLLQISPLLLDVVRELASISRARESLYRKREFSSAKCEDCGMFSDKLIEVNGRLICESCAEAYK
jgi:CBS-domain-containing membrane protein